MLALVRGPRPDHIHEVPRLLGLVPELWVPEPMAGVRIDAHLEHDWPDRGEPSSQLTTTMGECAMVFAVLCLWQRPNDHVPSRHCNWQEGPGTVANRTSSSHDRGRKRPGAGCCRGRTGPGAVAGGAQELWQKGPMSCGRRGPGAGCCRGTTGTDGPESRGPLGR